MGERGLVLFEVGAGKLSINLSLQAGIRDGRGDSQRSGRVLLAPGECQTQHRPQVAQGDFYKGE